MKCSLFHTYDQLVKQADVLQDISTKIQPETVERVQIAIAEDILFFQGVCSQETGKDLIEQFLAGEIEIKAATIEAARILVNLVLGEPL